MRKRILLDLFCGRWGWSRAFAKRGWYCIGVDLAEPPEIPDGCEFVCGDVTTIRSCGNEFWFENGFRIGSIDAIVASSPCEEFSIHGMKHFHPNPKYPVNGIKLFEHTRALCEASGLPYVMENVRAAQQFVGDATHHCGPFYLWGNAVPPLMNQGITKKQTFRAMPGNEYARIPVARRKELRNKYQRIREKEPFGITGSRRTWSGSTARKEAVARTSMIPIELSSHVAEFMERILGSGMKH